MSLRRMWISNRFVMAFCFVLLICLGERNLIAQTTNATINGQITDSQGRVVPDTDLTVVNIDTNIGYVTKTNAAGIYAVPGLPPGRYRLQVRKEGFKELNKTDITLNVQDILEQNFSLEVGSTSESVTVSGNSVNVNTTDGSVSTVIDRQFVENLPLNGRSFQSLLYLSPGVVPNAASANSVYAQGQFVVNGQRGDANYWMVDGVSGNIGMDLSIPGAGLAGAIGATNALGGTSALVSVDALQEFRMDTSTYAPEFGRVQGGQISIQTRSGTNQFHGTLFEYLRNTDLDATDWFAEHNGLPKTPEIQNDFGGVVGGPILKDRTFFFFSAEGLRLIRPQTFLGTVPDMTARMSAIPAMQPYLNMYPLPQPGAEVAGPGYVSYTATFSEPGSADAYSLRIDHQLVRNLNLFGRYSYAPSSVKQRGTNLNSANNLASVTSVTKTATAGATWAASARMIDDFRFNYSTSGGETSNNVDSLGGGTPFPGTQLFPGGAGLSYQNSQVLFYVAFGTNMRQTEGAATKDFQHQYNIVDTLSFQRGSHSLKFGVDYRRLSPAADNYYYQLLPLFGDMTGLEQGNTRLTVTDINAPQTFLLHNLGAFGQDTWRATNRLNLTYGLRWDVDFVPSNTRGLGLPAITGFSTSGLSHLALAPLGTPAYGTQYGNVAPRIGGAYRFSTNPEWGVVLRGGFGVFYGLTTTEIFNANYNENYYPLGALNYFYGVPFPTPSSIAGVPVIEPPNQENGNTLFGFDPHLKAPYALQWNVAVEQSLGKAQTFSLSYIGASDKRLLASEYITNPNPTYAVADLIANAGYSNFQALQAQFQRRLANGLQALASYTWSHSIDTGSYGDYTNGSLANVSANRGNSDFDTTNAFSGAVTYNPPAWTKNLLTRAITGGWSTDDEVQIRSGAPVDVQDGNFSGLTAVNSSVLIRPDVVPGQPRYLTGPQYPGRKALNPAAFTDPPVDPATGLLVRQGNLSRNASRALGLAQWDFAARRDFAIYERLRLQFRAELFNVLNHPNFGPFNSNFQTGNLFFGQSTQMLNQFLGGSYSGSGSQDSLYTPGSPRSGELALRLVF